MKPGVSIEYVYFIERGTVSINADATDRSIEVACIGREGMLGLSVVLGHTMMNVHAHVQLAGSALRMRADDLRTAMAASDTLRSALLSYAHTMICEITDTVAVAGCLPIVERLARFLLKVSDRIDEPAIPLTHDYIAKALGVRRSSVTTAMHVIEGERAVRSTRSLTTLTDTDQLRRVSGHSTTERRRAAIHPVANCPVQSRVAMD